MPRPTAQKWIALAWPCALFLSGTALAVPKVIDRMVAQVNEESILLSDLERAERDAKELLTAQNKKTNALDRREILQQLIDEKLLEQTLAKHRLLPSDQDLRDAEDQIRRQNGLSTLIELREVIERQGTRYDLFRKSLRRQIIDAKVIGYFIRPRISITENDLRTEYQHSLESAGQNMMVKLEQLSLPLPIEPKARERALARMRTLRSRAAQGTPLAQLAEVRKGKKGKGEEATPQRTEVPLIELANLAPEIQVEVDHLKPRQVSELVPGNGYVSFFRLLEKSSAGTSTFEEMKPRLEQQWQEREIRRQRALWQEELRQQAHIQMIPEEKDAPS